MAYACTECHTLMPTDAMTSGHWIVGSVTPIDDIGKMVNIGTLLAFVIVCVAILVLRRTDPAQPRPFRTPWVPLVPILAHTSSPFSTCMAK